MKNVVMAAGRKPDGGCGTSIERTAVRLLAALAVTACGAAPGRAEHYAGRKRLTMAEDRIAAIAAQAGMSLPADAQAPAAATPAAVCGGGQVCSTGNVAENDPPASRPLEFVTITGGQFAMGTDDGPSGDARPVHGVEIKTFEMSKTLVTVAQYEECVSKGFCTEPETGGYCNWGMAGRGDHPVNCVDWEQANQYAKFRGARLPSESEWEYAAKSAGRDQIYPWGDREPTCENVVKGGCGREGTMPVCSRPEGNTAQGLCDMAGNVAQWVQDTYQNSYAHAPSDGSAYEGLGSFRVLRGGSFHDQLSTSLRADNRFIDAGDRNAYAGFRIARSLGRAGGGS